MSINNKKSCFIVDSIYYHTCSGRHEYIMIHAVVDMQYIIIHAVVDMQYIINHAVVDMQYIINHAEGDMQYIINHAVVDMGYCSLHQAQLNRTCKKPTYIGSQDCKLQSQLILFSCFLSCIFIEFNF